MGSAKDYPRRSLQAVPAEARPPSAVPSISNHGAASDSYSSARRGSTYTAKYPVSHSQTYQPHTFDPEYDGTRYAKGLAS